MRPHPGAQRVAARLRALLDGSEVVASHADCGRVQDPYTLRCAPQVLGAIDDALAYVEAALERELHAVTDNPLVFPDDGDVVAGGNFHGQPLSLPLDHLALALCELASFSERRTYALLSPSYAELPAFLSPRPGLSSGLMLTQYAAAALVNECQVLAHPAGAGSIPTSAGQEDFNSMGAFAALKARTVVENCAQVIATELVCACQGLEFHRPLRTTPPLEAAVEQGARARAAHRGGSRRSAASWRRWPRRCEPGRSCCEMPGLGAGGGAADAREQPASRRGREPAGPRRLRRDRQGRARPRLAADDQARAPAPRAATRRCSCSRASRWRCSRRTRTRRAC